MTLDQITEAIKDLAKVDYWTTFEHKGAERAVYSLDVNLSIVSHHDDDVIVEDFQEDWATCHPDRSATSYSYNIYYGGTLVKYVVLVSVDGNRALLPLPDQATKTPKLFDYRVAQIMRPNSLDEYMQRAKLNFPEGS